MSKLILSKRSLSLDVMACTSNCLQYEVNENHTRRKVVVHNGGERQFQDPTEVKKITSGHYRVYMLVHSALSYAPLPPNTRLEPGEVHCLMPPHDQPFTLEVPLKLTRQGTCARRKMKIAVTRQQLGLLLRNSKQFKLKGIAAGLFESFKVGDRKWQPSLVSILKVQKFEKVGIFQLLIHWLRYREYRCVQAWKGQTNIEDDAG